MCSFLLWYMCFFFFSVQSQSIYGGLFLPLFLWSRANSHFIKHETEKNKIKNPSHVFWEISLHCRVSSAALFTERYWWNPSKRFWSKFAFLALGQHAVKVLFYLCAGWEIKLVSGFLTHHMTSYQEKYFWLAIIESSRKKYRFSFNTHCISPTFPSMSQFLSMVPTRAVIVHP